MLPVIEISWDIKIGTRTMIATIANPTRVRRLATIAHPRGMKRENARTRKEMGSASANPPSNIIGTLGESHIRSTSATTRAKRSTFLVRLEIQIGVGLVCGELTPPADPSCCLAFLLPVAEKLSIRGASLLRLFVPVPAIGGQVVDLLVHFRAKKHDVRRDVDVNQHHDDRAQAAVDGPVVPEVVHVEGE